MPKQLIATLLLALLLPLSAAAQPGDVDFTKADTLSIRFRLDSIHIDMDFANNREAWRKFEEAFYETYQSGRKNSSLRIDIYSGASPEGTPDHNRWLGENRGIAVRRLIRQQFGNRVGNIIIHNEAARWEAFYDAVAASNEPWRDEVLEIIQRPTSKQQDRRDEREEILRKLHGGTVWPVLLEKYLAPLRSGATAILSWEQKEPDTIFVKQEPDTIYIQQPIISPVTVVEQPVDDKFTDAVAKKVEERKPVVRRPVWILRTNLPLLGTGTPNLQAEWSLDHRDRWSINIEAVASWWTFAYNAYANQLLLGGVEIRHWLGNRKRHHTLSGWHIGLAVGGGYGDLEWKSKGYQFEAFTGFVNLGWQHRFGKRRQWAFDAGIGLGYLYAPNRKYWGSTIYPEHHTERHDDHLMWLQTRHLNWVGAPHANLSIGYVFHTRKGLYRRQQAMERDAERERLLQRTDSLRELERERKDSLYVATLKQKEESRKQIADAKAESRKQKREAELKQKAESRKQKAETKKQKREAKAATKLAAIEAKARADTHRGLMRERAKKARKAPR